MDPLARVGHHCRVHPPPSTGPRTTTVYVAGRPSRRRRGRRPDPLLVGGLAGLAVGVLAGLVMAAWPLLAPDPAGEPVAQGSSAVATPGQAASVTPSPSPTAARPPAAGDQIVLKGTGSGLCLDLDGDANSDGVAMRIGPCSGAPTQSWRLDPAGPPDTFLLINVASGKCLDVFAFSQADGGRIVQWACTRNANQQWRIAGQNQAYAVISVHSSRCLDVTGGATAAGTPVQQYQCNGTPAQGWTLRP